MNSIRLTDLDELILTVRDKASRSYITEAANAYRGGAYRAAIISTWIAVIFDIIAKIRELSAQGDKMAQVLVTDLDKAIANKDIKALQRFEDGLLKKACDDFEFLSQHEYEDLERLKEDRNLCAHPAFVTDELLFDPKPERVRMHLVHAVTYLLQHQPVQGKNALARIIEDIKNYVFLSDLDTLCNFLGPRYLHRAKDALIQNLIIVLLKALLKGEDQNLPTNYGQQIVLSLQAVARICPKIYEEKMSSQLATIVGELNGNRPAATYRLLGGDPRCWNWLGGESRALLKSGINHYVSQSETHHAPFRALGVDELRPAILAAFDLLSDEKKVFLIKNLPHPALADRAIALYSSAKGWREAESLGETVILPMVRCFSDNDISKILQAATENTKIWDASGTPEILGRFYDGTLSRIQFTKEAWQNFFTYFLENYNPQWVERTWGELRKKLEIAGVSIPEASRETD